MNYDNTTINEEGSAPNERTVQIYDPKTKHISQIPESELAPGWIKAKIQGTDRVFFVEAAQLNSKGEFKHERFTGERRRLMKYFSRVFASVYPRTRQEWEDEFRKDQNPDKEIAIWTVIADVFEYFTKGRSFPFKTKMDYFRIIVSWSINGLDAALQVINLKMLSMEQAQEVIDYIKSRCS